MDPSLSIEKAVSREDGDSSLEQRAAAHNAKGKPLVTSMWETLEALPKRPDTIDGPTIFRVPFNLRKNKELFVEPSVVSIGPYHHGRKHLSAIEDKKWVLLQEMLSDLDGKVTLEACVEKIKSLQHQAHSCYSERVNVDDDSFVEMLILDGTFIIQYIFCTSHSWFMKEIGWASNCIEADLIMLENQIPFFVIQSLWDLYIPGSPLLDPKNLEVIRSNLCHDFQLGNNHIPENRFHHLLHLCHHIAVPNMSAHTSVLPGRSCFEFCTALNCHSLLPCLSSKHENPHVYKIPCATELEDAGIKCRKKKPPSKMMDVTLQGGTLEIPCIYVGDRTKPLFINLLAFEQSQMSSVPMYLTSYAFFMDSIINTRHDVEILQRHGIIENLLSGEEAVALFFNQLCDGAIILRNHYYSHLFKEVNRYCDSNYHRSRAKLVRDYFNSPWSTISFVAACILLGLTVAQTYYSGYDHYHPSP